MEAFSSSCKTFFAFSSSLLQSSYVWGQRTSWAWSCVQLSSISLLSSLWSSLRCFWDFVTSLLILMKEKRLLFFTWKAKNTRSRTRVFWLREKHKTAEIIEWIKVYSLNDFFGKWLDCCCSLFLSFYLSLSMSLPFPLIRSLRTCF